MATLLGLVVGFPRAAHAQEVGSVVSIAGMSQADTGLPDCPGHPGGPVSTGSVTFSRTGATDDALSVGYDVTGPVVTPHGTATFAAGSPTVTIAVTPTVHAQLPDIEVSVDAGDGYDVGDPATIKLEVVLAPVDPVVYCEQFTDTTTSTTTIPAAGTTPTSTPPASVAPIAPAPTVTVPDDLVPSTLGPESVSSDSVAAASVVATDPGAGALPQTGARDPRGLMTLGLSLFGAGALLVLARRRRAV